MAIRFFDARLFGLFAVYAAAAAAGAPELPKTPAARVVEAYLAMLNDGSPAAVAAFENSWGSTARKVRPNAPKRPAAVAEMHQKWGAVKVLKVISTGDNSITLSVGISTGEPIEMEFKLDASEPEKLDSVIISSRDSGSPPQKLEAGAQGKIVAVAAAALQEGYVYPDVAEKMAASVQEKLKAGAYDGIADDTALAARLTQDLQAISKDKHLRVRVAPQQTGAAPPEDGPSMQEMRSRNYGFQRVEILPGNIGYLRFDHFANTDEAKATASAALGFLAHCDALIIDLRQNGGGSPVMIQYLCSHLFSERTHLNDMVDRNGKTVEEFWTLDTVPGPRFAASVPVYVLTSSRTFSGAEEFAYDLKNLKRATIVGETTGGGAHPVRILRLNDRLVITVPFRRALNPVSKSNWEGTGVEPDVKTSAAAALDRATELAEAAIGGRPK